VSKSLTALRRATGNVSYQMVGMVGVIERVVETSRVPYVVVRPYAGSLRSLGHIPYRHPAERDSRMYGKTVIDRRECVTSMRSVRRSGCKNNAGRTGSFPGASREESSPRFPSYHPRSPKGERERDSTRVGLGRRLKRNVDTICV